MATTALITGATGLIGGHVVRHWDIRGLEPVFLDRRSEDLLTPGVPTALVRRLRPAVVVHLAWTASGTPGYRTSPDNDRWVEASLELERACQDAGAWLVATGTVLDSTGDSPDAYSAAKVRLRHALTPAIAAQTVTWLRPYYVVDPEMRRPALIADALAARDAGVTLGLRTPESRHDFIHASDVGRAVVVTVRHRLHGVVPIGSGRLRTVRDLVAALGVPWIPTADAPTAISQHHEAADSTRLRDLGWSPKLTEQLFGGR